MAEVGKISVAVELDAQNAVRQQQQFQKQLKRFARDSKQAADALKRQSTVVNIFGREIRSAASPVNILAKQQAQLKKQGIATTSSLQKQIIVLGNLRKRFKDDAVAVRELDKRLGKLKDRLEGLDPVFGQARRGTRGLGTASAAAGQTAIQFGRGLEDLSFGFVGVANNVPVFLEALDRTRVASKLAGTSLTKTLITSLLGPTGLIVAFQAVTFVALTFGDDIKAAFGVAGKAAKKARDEIASALEEIIDFGEEVFGVTIETEDLKKVEENLSKTLNLRKRSLKAENDTLKSLQDQLGELTRAARERGKATDAENKQSRSLGKRLQTQRLLIAEAKELVTDSELELAAIEARLKLQERQLRLQNDLLDAGGKLTTEVEEQAEAAAKGAKSAEEIAKAFERVTRAIEEAQAARLTGLLGPSIEDITRGKRPGILTIPIGLRRPSLDPTFGRIEDAGDRAARAAGKFIVFQKAAARLGDELRAGVINPLEATRAKIKLLEKAIRELLDAGFDPASDEVQQFSEQLAILNGQINMTAETFGVFGDAADAVGDFVGDAVSGFQEVGTAAEELRAILRGLLRDLIAAAAKAAIFAGISALTGGTATFGSFFKKFIGLQAGGIVTRPTAAILGEAGPEAVIPLSRLGNLSSPQAPTRLEVVAFRVSGGDLLLTLKEAQAAEGRGLGGIALNS